MAKKTSGRSHHDIALDKLSARLDELLDLYKRLALHVGFVDEPTQSTKATDAGQRKNVVFALVLSDIQALKEWAYKETKKTGRRVTQQSIVDAALKAYLYK